MELAEVDARTVNRKCVCGVRYADCVISEDSAQ